MDVITNFAGSISPSQFGGKDQGLNTNFDPNDTTFENLLNKQMDNHIEENSFGKINNFGMRYGIDIGDFDGRIPNFSTVKDNTAMNKIENIEKTEMEKFNNGKDFSTSEVLTFFQSLFNNKPTLTQAHSNGLFDYERKMAASSYRRYAKNIVTDIHEFVTDALSLS